MEDVNQNEMMPAKLPGFLKVLCILTFVGAGLGVIFGLINLVQAPFALEKFQMTQDLMGDMGSMEGVPGGGLMSSMMDGAYQAALHALPLAIAALSANLLCLFGALMMWKRKKIGFFAYLGGQLVGVVVPIVLVGFSGIFGGFMVLAAIFPVVFIIMYALNFKHLTN